MWHLLCNSKVRSCQKWRRRAYSSQSLRCRWPRHLHRSYSCMHKPIVWDNYLPMITMLTNDDAKKMLNKKKTPLEEECVHRELVHHRWQSNRFPSTEDDNAANPVPPNQQHFIPVLLSPPHLQVFQSRLPTHLLSKCDVLIEHCEQHAAKRIGGWQTNLFSLTKQDIAVKDLPSDWQCPELGDYVVHTIETLYQRRIVMDRNQPHVLKYDANHTFVPLHYDSCALTVNLVLNDEFTGGGTYFRDLHATLLCAKGEFLIHPGHLLHCGCAITSGMRYLMVWFVNFES